MPKLSLKSGTASKTVNILFQDASKTNGAGLTGVTNNSTGLLAHFLREGDSASTAMAVTSAAIGTWTSNGLVEVESSAMPGLYQFGLPNAICSAGSNARSAVVYFAGVANLVPCLLEIEITQVDNQDGVRFGMTALPNANAASSGGLLTSGTGANQIATSAGAVLLQAGAATGQLDFTAGVVKANVVQTLGTTSTGQAGSVGIDWSQIVNKTAVVDLTQTIISSVSGNVGGSVGSVTGSVGSVTGSVGSVTASVIVGSVSAGVTVPANVTQIAGAAVSTTTAQLGVNVVKYNNQTAVTDGNNFPSVNIVDIAGSASTGASGFVGIDWGQITNKTTSNAFTQTVISAVSGSVQSVTGAVGSVTGNVGGNVVGSVGSVTAGVTVAAVSAGILPSNFSVLGIDATGNVKTQSTIKKNAIVSGFSFVMTDNTTHNPRTGLTVSANRSIDGAAFAPCVNNVTEISNGIYTINLAAADVNGNNIMLRFVAASADDQDLLLITNP